MKNRIELAKYFHELGYTKGAEIGVFDGHYAELLCQNIPGVKLYGIDCWEVYRGYRDHKFQKSMDEAYLKAVIKMIPFNTQLIKLYSDQAFKLFPDEYFDFVFIDGNHAYEYVKQDIAFWGPKVKRGGIISGHDYYVTHTGNVGVINAVDEYVKEHNYQLFLTEWDRENPVPDDRQPCWYFMRT